MERKTLKLISKHVWYFGSPFEWRKSSNNLFITFTHFLSLSEFSQTKHSQQRWLDFCVHVSRRIQRSESRSKFEFACANKKSLVCKENKAFNWKRLKMVGGILRMFGMKVESWSRNVWKIETHTLPWIMWKSLKKREEPKCVCIALSKNL